jgi:hypothetical protein
MAVFKIFPTADTTLYSRFPNQNTGLDEILEVSVKNNSDSISYLVDPDPNSVILNDDIRRSLILFSNSDIAKIKTYATSSSWKTNLKLYLANAENLNTTYSLQIYQVSSSWTMGTGKFSDYPVTINGACWYNPNQYVGATNAWTGNTSYFLTPGGGNWTGSYASQSFSYKDPKDLNADVTSIVRNWFSGSNNNGFIIKHPAEVEQSSGSFVALNFFSVDTHTIYPPTLEIKWDDSYYSTGSLIVINNNQFIASIDNNLGTYKYNTQKYQFRVNARDKYPARVFTTASIYNINKALPQSSYWAIQDVKTEDVVVDFDTTFTKISCDGQSSYFDVYLDGLEPERYYKLLLRTVLPTSESIDIDNNYIFKIVR